MNHQGYIKKPFKAKFNIYYDDLITIDTYIGLFLRIRNPPQYTLDTIFENLISQHAIVNHQSKTKFCFGDFRHKFNESI